MSKPGTWLRERAIDLTGRLKERGMTLSVDAAETLLVERHRIAVEQLGVTGRTGPSLHT